MQFDMLRMPGHEGIKYSGLELFLPGGLLRSELDYQIGSGMNLVILERPARWKQE